MMGAMESKGSSRPPAAPSSRTLLWALVVLLGVLLVGGVLVLLLVPRSAFHTPQENAQREVQERAGRSATWRVAAEAVKVPEKGEQTDPNVAAPQEVIAASPRSGAHIRVFRIVAENDTFSPRKIVVYQGDVAHIMLAARDKEYDLTQPDYGIHLLVPQGSEKFAEVQATAAGTFTFYCERCGGLAEGPQGEIVVVAPPQ
ncbi:hypothetical protein D6833_11050 [Candidatus Parcubacteria bacterium]|nr:MAG: hypothetical protein D6833_11050 [Candidatus Parcubacteria bacterium]